MWRHFDVIVSRYDITDKILLLFGNVVTMGSLIWVMKTKGRIYGLREQGFGAKALRGSYRDKNWHLNTLKTICHLVDKTGSAVTRHAGRVG